MIDASPIRDRFIAVAPHLDERGRRLFAAAEARLAGYGGIAAVARAPHVSPSTPVPTHSDFKRGQKSSASSFSLRGEVHHG